MQPSTEQTYRQRILKVMVYIGDHLDGDLGLDAMARLSCFSPYHFHRIFRGQAGEPLGQYVRRLRMERAAARLKQTQLSVLEVALEAGFEAHESFTRVFREMFGVPPSEYRKSLGVALGPAVGAELEPRPTGAQIMQVKIQTLKPRRIASIRHIGPYPEIGPVFGRLCQWAGMRNVFGPDTQMLGIYYDDPDTTPADKLRSEAAVTVGDGVEGEEDVAISELAGGDYAVVRHKGCYSKLIDTYRWVYGQWLPTSGREPGDVPCFEVYLNDPNEVKPEELETDVYVPLKG
jgi:AraC family transcriptional regulator